MPKLVLLALCLFACTLPVPLFVWGNTTNWRAALAAWKQFSLWMGALYLLGLIVWLGMGAP